MSEHAEAEKGQCYRLREEHSPQEGGHIRESIAYTTDDDVLEDGRTLDERTARFIRNEVSFF
jgi:hypothetical protein